MYKRPKARSARSMPKVPSSAMAIIRGCLLGMIFTLSAILLFALLLKIGLIGEDGIPIVNQILKIAGICIAAIISVRGQTDRMWLFGGIGGACYIACGVLLFSLIEGEFSPSWLLLSDLGMGLIAGVIIGFILQKLKK
ncbi:MAG: TIGR04086 family membrane protein [Bacillota bacterium]